ncbi:hypothetical protein PUR71_36290 [Streptomyces sp. SP17BM10]|uniref:hypothetical protein n=1 Tax=Streptomyces sp. SP17BM10 TaxID=3002530 RepID=UPI002E788992|nr:hypothetical protein [Streptomyces sp. SP17BM10]MEE1788319.1 hypothetical protein [Streptomyces sp. SP17BM10]
MNLGDLLRADSAGLDEEFRDHDPADFTRRLAHRLAADGPAGGRPAAERSAGAGRDRTVRPAGGRRTGAARRDGAGRAELRRDLRHLCWGVAGTVEPCELALDLELAEKAALRTLGCLLYGMDRTADAVFWWRIAAQYGDQLAVHCLAVHYAAEGEDGDAARWAVQAQDLSAPGRLPALAPDVRPDGAAELVRLLAERFDGEIVLTLREIPAAASPGADGGRLGVRAVRGRGPARIR